MKHRTHGNGISLAETQPHAIKAASTGHRMYYFNAESEDDKLRWMAALNDAINKLNAHAHGTDPVSWHDCTFMLTSCYRAAEQEKETALERKRSRRVKELGSVCIALQSAHLTQHSSINMDVEVTEDLLETAQYFGHLYRQSASSSSWSRQFFVLKVPQCAIHG